MAEQPNEGSSQDNDFVCSNCNLTVRCRFGKLLFENNRYLNECYYLRDPFIPPDIHKSQKEYSIDDFVVIGSNCFICSQPVCIDEECSTFYKNTYCLKCVRRENQSFPEELISNILRPRSEVRKC